MSTETEESSKIEDVMYGTTATLSKFSVGLLCKTNKEIMIK